MGEADVSGTGRLISTQPHMGSLFKSQNNRTWSAVQSQDKKFTLYKAKFDQIQALGLRGFVGLTNDNISELNPAIVVITVKKQGLIICLIVLNNKDS